MSAIDESLAIMARVGRRARWVIWGCIALLLALIALVSFELPHLLLLNRQVASVVPQTPGVSMALAVLPMTQRAALFVILLIGSAPHLWALAEAAALAKLMAQGEGFSPRLPSRLQRIGWALVLTFVSRPLAGMGLSALITDHLAGIGELNVQRAATLALAFTSDDLGFVLIGVATIALAAIARRIVAVAEDARGIV